MFLKLLALKEVIIFKINLKEFSAACCFKNDAEKRKEKRENRILLFSQGIEIILLPFLQQLLQLLQLRVFL